MYVFNTVFMTIITKYFPLVDVSWSQENGSDKKIKLKELDIREKVLAFNKKDLAEIAK